MLRKLGIVLSFALVGGLVVGTGSALATHTFPDVPDGAFYSDAVDWAFDHGITTGYGSTGEFRPDLPTTRGQMVTFLDRLNDLDPWAVVGSGGGLARGSDGVSSAKVSTGAYQVLFDRDVRDCAFVAVLGRTAGGVAAAGTATTARRLGNAKGVFVKTHDDAGTPTDRSFHLTVNC